MSPKDERPQDRLGHAESEGNMNSRTVVTGGEEGCAVGKGNAGEAWHNKQRSSPTRVVIHHHVDLTGMLLYHAALFAARLVSFYFSCVTVRVCVSHTVHVLQQRECCVAPVAFPPGSPRFSRP